ncbi:unnamed protein product [Prunus brigantina]
MLVETLPQNFLMTRYSFYLLQLCSFTTCQTLRLLYRSCSILHQVLVGAVHKIPKSSWNAKESVQTAGYGCSLYLLCHQQKNFFMKLLVLMLR